MSSRVIKSSRLAFSSPKTVKLFHVVPGSVVRPEPDDTDVIAETEAVVRGLLERAQKQAHSIIASAKQEAAQLVETARKERETELAAAREEGFRTGTAEAWAQVEAEKSRILTEARQILQEAREKRIAILQGADQELVELAMAIARKVIDLKLEQDRALVVQVVRQALARAVECREVIMKVNPADYEVIVEAQTGLELDIPVWQKLTIQTDPAIEPGGVLIDTGSGLINAQIGRQMAEIRQALQGVTIIEPGPPSEGCC